MSEIADKIEKEKLKQTKLEEMALRKSELRQMDEAGRKIDDAVLADVTEETSECFLMETDNDQVSPRYTVTDSRTEVDSSEPMQEEFLETSSGKACLCVLTLLFINSGS